jgi:PAS domain S-box-containing protein
MSHWGIMKSSRRTEPNHFIAEENYPEGQAGEAEIRYRTLFEQSPDGLLIIDTDGTIIDFNETASRQLGFSREEFAALKISDIYAIESLEDVQDRIKSLLKGEKAEFEVRQRTKDGQMKDVHVITRPIVLSGRTVFHSIWRDITAQKRAEQSIRQSEEKFRTLFESATDALFILDLEGNFIAVNKTAYERLGYTREEMLSMHLSRLDPPEFAAKVSARLQQVLNRGHAVMESAHLKKDGSVMPVEINARIIEYDGRKAVFSIIRDISERKRAEEQLADLNARLQTLIRSIPDLVAFKDTGGRHVVVNKALEEFTGLSQSELIGKTNADLLPAELLESCNRSDETVLRDLKPLQYEEYYTDRAGEIRYFDTIKTPIFDGPDVAGIVTVSREITDRKKIEEQVRSSLREKEVLLKEVHHRVKNNLQIVASMLELQSGYIEDREARILFQESQKRVESMSLIHEKLYRSKDLARIDYSEYVEDLVDNLLTLNTATSELVEMKLDIEGIMLDVNSAIPCALIINELVTNALRHAFPGDGIGRIEIKMRRGSEGEISVTVGDNGVGLHKSVDFRNTKTLGMQLVISLVDQLGGTIELDRSRGTSFTVTFPA